MTDTLKQRIQNYINIANFHLLPKLPLVMMVNMKNASKLSNLLDKPYSPQFMETLTATASRLIQEIDGVIFTYIFNDEIVIISRNDQNIDTQPYCNNDIQKIASIVSSVATQYFNNYSTSISLGITEAIFTTQVFTVPNTNEIINTLIFKQQHNLQESVQQACFYEFLKKGMNKNEIKEMTNGASREEKINLLQQECKVSFNDYPAAFRYGVACYKKPQIIDYEGQEIIKNKWFLDIDLPLFTKNSFLQDILKKEREN